MVRGTDGLSVFSMASRLGDLLRMDAFPGSDPLLLARYRAIVTTHAAAGVISLAVLLGYLVVYRPTDLVVVFSLALLVTPLGVAFLLARTGWLQTSHMISALALTTLISFVAWHTGGLTSFLLVWLVVVPVESALSASRRTIAFGLALPVAAFAILLAGQQWQLLPVDRTPDWSPLLLGVVGTGSALLYAGLVALNVQRLASRSEEVARDSERLYRLMAENATDLITLHYADGTTTFVAPGAARVLGQDNITVEGEGLAEAIAPEYRPVLLEALCATAQDGLERSVDLKTISSAADRPSRWIETRCRRLDDDLDEYGGVVIAVSRDLTQRKSAEETLEKAKNEAERASRSKSRFLATVSHELRTPLNAIIGLSEVLSNPNRSGRESEQDAEFVTLIHESGQHLLNVVNDLLDMSKLDAGRYEITREPFDMRSVLRECVEVMRPTAAADNICIEWIDGQDPVPVFADRRSLKQIALNLLSNAVKFTNEGGRVTVTAWTAGSSSLFSVKDTGVGIDTEAQKHLGEPFYQIDGGKDRSHDGTGLGLSIVKGLVELHGGRLDIQSRLGEGACFTIELASAETNHLDANNLSVSPGAMSHRRVEGVVYSADAAE